MQAEYLIPLAPLAGFCLALAIGFGWAAYHEHTEQRAPARVKREPRR